MRVDNSHESLPSNSVASERTLQECVHSILGESFRAELRGALSLRRIPSVAIRVDDLEEIRAAALIRLFQLRAENPSAPLSVSSLRSAVSIAVYHHYCREVRRRRVVRILTLDAVASSLEAPQATERVRNFTLTSESYSPSTLDGVVKPVVASARAHVGQLLTLLADSLLGGRAGGHRQNPRGAELHGVQGVVRWLRQYEGDRSTADLTRTLADHAADARVAVPSSLILAMRASTHWEGCASGLARLAHTAVVTPETPVNGSPSARHTLDGKEN